MSALEKETAERFKRDTAQHVMTVLHDDGLYRHLRFGNPGSSFYWFDIVTWPGSLAFRGDMDGGYIFSRVTDMFMFFRRNGNSHGINPHYWAQKLPDCGKSVREYSDDVLKAELGLRIAEYEKGGYADLAAAYERDKAAYDAATHRQRWPYGNVKEPTPPESPDELRKLIAEYNDNGDLAHEEGARELLRELERAGVVSGTWEWDLSDWDWSFLWACHAIVWGIAQYDAAKKPAVEVLVPTGGLL